MLSQNFPEKVSKEGLVLDGKIINRTTSWSADKTIIYTLNWFEIDDLYYGQPFSNRNIIPVLTEGGGTEEGLLIISHTLNFHQGYNYLLALEPCNDCIEGTTVYIPHGEIGNFNKVPYIKEKKKWASKNRITTAFKEKECDQEENTLLISFSNIHVQEIGTAGIQGYVDLKTKTTQQSKVLYDLTSKVKYDANVFGQYVIANQHLEISPVENTMQEAYTTQAIDEEPDRAYFSTTNNSTSAEAILVDTVYQSTIRLSFVIDPANISELPSDLSELFSLEGLSGSFFCDGRPTSFTSIIVEDKPIGVVMDGKTGGITYTIDNVEFDQVNQDYFFTIFASSTETTFLRQSILRFDYSNTTFFPNQVSSGNVQIINEPGTIAADFPYSLSQSDLDNNSYRLVIGEIFQPNPGDEYAIITSDPVPLVRIKFETQNCTQNPMLSFQELEMQGISFFYDENLPPFFVVAYDPVIANDIEQVPPCGCEDVNIDSYSPEEIVAGDNQILTITGSNFGVYQRGANPGMDGTGSSVLFKNGDYTNLPNPNAPPEFIGAGEADFIIDGVLEWTDTRIKVKVPSTDWQAGPNGPAATGKFIVRNGCNEEDQHPGLFQNLRIPHSLLNTRTENEGKAKRLGLRNNNGLNGEQDGYEFLFNQNIATANLNIKDAFKDALSIWCENTNIRFKVRQVDAPMLLPVLPGDGRNIIAISSLGDPNAQAAVRLSQYFQIDCDGSDPNNDNGGFIMTDIDVVVEPNFANGNDEVRAKRVFTHELGHAHMLNHAFCFGFACSGPLMHPQGESGIKDVDIDGGNKIYDDSQEIVNNDCFLGNVQVLNTQPIQAGSCGQIVATKELPNYSISILPNPTAESVFIEGISERIDFKLVNTTGQILQTGKRSDNFTIPLSPYPQGAYWLNIANKTENIYFKIIKL